MTLPLMLTIPFRCTLLESTSEKWLESLSLPTPKPKSTADMKGDAKSEYSVVDCSCMACGEKVRLRPLFVEADCSPSKLLFALLLDLSVELHSLGTGAVIEECRMRPRCSQLITELDSRQGKAAEVWMIHCSCPRPFPQHVFAIDVAFV